MRKKIIILVSLVFLSIAGTALSVGVSIRIRLVGYQTQIDPRFIDGKLYKKPIHPGFITQRVPRITTRVAKKKGILSIGLATAREYERR